MLVNLLGALFACFVFFWSFWPASTPVDTKSMKYDVVMFGGAVMLALLLFPVKAWKTYAGPVTKTEGFQKQ